MYGSSIFVSGTGETPRETAEEKEGEKGRKKSRGARKADHFMIKRMIKRPYI